MLGFAALAAFVPLAAGPGLLLGTMDVDLVLTLAGVLSAVVLALALAAETAEGTRRARLGKRELVLTLTVLLAFVASYHAGDLFLAMVAVAVVLPTVLLAQRVRHARTEDLEPGLLRRLPYAAQAANVWLFAALLGVASLPGTFALYELMFPDSHRTIVLAFWIGLAALALLALVPRRRISLAFNLLVALGSLFLVVQLVQLERGPEDAVAIDLPFEGVWFVASGGRSTLVNGHYPLRVQRHALDLFQVVDGKTHRGGADLLTNYYTYGKRLPSPGDGKVTAVIDSRPDAPVGDSDLEHPEGNIVVIDIGGGRYVLYAHLKQGSARVRRRRPRRVRTGHRPRRRLGELGRAAPAHPGAELAVVRDRRRRPRDVPDPLPRHDRDPRRRRPPTDERGRPARRPGRRALAVVVHDLDVVAVGVEHERAVVALVVLAGARRALRCRGTPPRSQRGETH